MSSLGRLIPSPFPGADLAPTAAVEDCCLLSSTSRLSLLSRTAWKYQVVVVLQFAKLCPEVTIFFTLSSYNVTFQFTLRSTETHPISLFILLTMRKVACKKHWDQIVFETNFYIVLYSVFVYMVSCNILLLLFTSHHLPIVRFFPCSKHDRQWMTTRIL